MSRNTTPQVVYTQAPTTVVVVEEDDDADEAVAAGLIGFTAGIAIGAAMDNNYYYGPYGWRGGAYMYNDAWDDYYDHREDAREDWQDHREDLVEERGDRAENRSEQRTERAEHDPGAADGSSADAAGKPAGGAGATNGAGTRRGDPGRDRTDTTFGPHGECRSPRLRRGQQEPANDSNGPGSSDAFSGYSSGRSQRSSSARGQQSRSSSRSRGGGGRRR